MICPTCAACRHSERAIPRSTNTPCSSWRLGSACCQALSSYTHTQPLAHSPAYWPLTHTSIRINTNIYIVHACTYVAAATEHPANQVDLVRDNLSGIGWIHEMLLSITVLAIWSFGLRGIGNLGAKNLDSQLHSELRLLIRGYIIIEVCTKQVCTTQLFGSIESGWITSRIFQAVEQ